jgi:deoxycytidylate deaminase
MYVPHRELLVMVYEEARKSPNNSIQVGAMLYFPSVMGKGTPIDSTLAHNGIDFRLADTPQRWIGQAKADYVEHAERACIYQAAKNGVATTNLGLVATWVACPDCARAIIGSGLKEVLVDRASLEYTTPKWKRAVRQGLAMIEEAGIKLVVHEEDISRSVPLRQHQY